MNLILQAIKSLFRKIEANRTHYDDRHIVNSPIMSAEGTTTAWGYIKVADTLDFDINMCTTFTVTCNDGFIAKNEPIYLEQYGNSFDIVLSKYDWYIALYFPTQADADYYWGDGDIDNPFTPGLYIYATNEDGYSEDEYPNGIGIPASVTCSFSYQTGELKTLDEKYLPRKILSEIQVVQDMAINAEQIAEQIAEQTGEISQTITGKMNTYNPIGIGSFSMNRKANTDIGENSHTEGYNTAATYKYAHAEGNSTLACDTAAHAEGYNSTANGIAAHAEGCAYASGSYQHAQGKYNIVSGAYAHIVGNGIGTAAKSNAHTLDWDGNATFAGKVTGTGADYAEYFEWVDGNPEGEDRVSLIVTLDGDKIRIANQGDDILGVVSGTAMVLGDNAEWEWRQKYLVDDYGRAITEMVEEFIEITDPETSEVTKISTGFFPHRKLNPEYDPEKEYIRRCDRKEWESIGLLGKIHVTDDGSCVVGGYATVGTNGIATASTEKTNMRVMKRITDSIILVLLK